MYIDLLVKEYTADIASSQEYPAYFRILTFVCCFSVAVCVTFIGFWADFLHLNWSVTVMAVIAIGSGILAVALMVAIGIIIKTKKIEENTEISKEEEAVKDRKEKIEKFLKRHKLECMDAEQMQELIKCIEERENELQFFKPMYSKIKGLFVAYIIPIGIYTVTSISQGLDTSKLVLGSIWLIFILAVLFVVVYFIVKLAKEIWDKPMRRYRVMAQDLRVYCALNGK